MGEVIKRQSRPPVDLFVFYLWLQVRNFGSNHSPCPWRSEPCLYLCSQREGAEDTLDFWLDVQQHENLCRAYFKDLPKRGVSVREDWPQYWELARRRGSVRRLFQVG